MKSGTRRIFSGLFATALAVALSTSAFATDTLEKSVKSTTNTPSLEAVNTVLDAEKSLANVSNAGKAWVALDFVKDSFGMGSTATLTLTVNQSKAGNQLKSFSDVPSSHWAYTAIMDMVSRGMFAGTKAPDANGVGEFNPNGTMTRAQFITVITRYLYSDELNAMSKVQGQPWYYNNYIIAVEKGLIKKSDFSMDAKEMNVGMSREEMAYVLVRAMDIMGESTGSTIANSRIPDYNSIGTAYRSHVKIAYTKGLIVGTDAKGTFNPKGTLNRAQAATVIYRLIAPETRTPVDPNTSITVTPDDGVEDSKPVTSTWVEGEVHGIPKAGDTVIKADGTKVVLKETNGILGLYQGVDIYTGMQYKGVSMKEGMICKDISYRPFNKCSVTGEMYPADVWGKIMEMTNPNKKNVVGEYEGEPYGYGNWWAWDSLYREWTWAGPAY